MTGGLGPWLRRNIVAVLVFPIIPVICIAVYKQQYGIETGVKDKPERADQTTDTTSTS